jgi:hypothetical protein
MVALGRSVRSDRFKATRCATRLGLICLGRRLVGTRGPARRELAIGERVGPRDGGAHAMHGRTGLATAIRFTSTSADVYNTQATWAGRHSLESAVTGINRATS